MVDARYGADGPRTRFVAATGLIAALSSFLCCTLCVVATGYGADALALAAGLLATVSVVVTMVSFECDGKRRDRRRQLSLVVPVDEPIVATTG
ncbi:hypothetical protein LV457_03710 [Mycobacterium sp. MYCO198283]|uniref:hypothetical protein n=1 Tax=Mycobacterium sp. MYCO198283 TaxID=2883505 RepID=UPI001E5FA6F9|nr:hypothetical protein [Mycobacterium sp. MYCO198283]MCG5431395.1 hypothetical protein [Mycobacterium sp. MYCO198283]